MKRVRDRLKELDHKLYESLMRSHEIAWNEWLPALSVKHDSYNSFPHIRNLEMYLDTVVQAYEENNKREFFISAVEIYIILASILFHDIGKVTSSDKHASESSLIICGKSELLKLPGEPKKTNHKVWASLGIPSFELALSIGRICEYHDIEKEKDKDKKNNLKKTLATICIDAYGEVRQKALASLLMLLDHLDSAHTRIMPEYLTGSGEVKVVGAFRRVITGVYIDLKTNIVRTVLNESLPDGNESEVSYKLNCSSINASLDILKKWAKKSGKTYKTIFDLNNFTIRKPEDLQTIIDEFDQLFNEPDISIPQDLSSFLSELKSKPKNYKYIESFFTSRDDKSSLEGMIDTIVKLWKEYEYYLSTQNRKVPNEIMAIFKLIQKVRKNKTDGSLYSDNGDAELYETLYRIYTKLIGLHKNIILQAKKVPEDIKAFFKLVKECISANYKYFIDFYSFGDSKREPDILDILVIKGFLYTNIQIQRDVWPQKIIQDLILGNVATNQNALSLIKADLESLEIPISSWLIDHREHLYNAYGWETYEPIFNKNYLIEVSRRMWELSTQIFGVSYFTYEELAASMRDPDVSKVKLAVRRISIITSSLDKNNETTIMAGDTRWKWIVGNANPNNNNRCYINGIDVIVQCIKNDIGEPNGTC